MLTQPLQGRIGKNHIVFFICRPTCDVGFDPFGSHARSPGLFQHVVRRIKSLQLGLRPAGGENGRRIAGPAAQVDDALWAIATHARQQFDRGPRAFIAISHVDGRIPNHQVISQSGISTRNTVPPSPVDTRTMSPPCARAKSRAMARPRPEPPLRAAVAKGWKSLACTPGGIPGPLSITSMPTRWA